MGRYLPYPGLVTPTQWGSRHGSLTGTGITLEQFTQAPWDTSDGWVFHWPGGSSDTDTVDPKLWIRNIESYHISTLGWDSFAYNYAIDRNGTVYGCVGETRGNATKNKTSTTRAVLFLYADVPTTAMKNAAMALWSLAPGQVRGHRDWRDFDDDYDDLRGDCPGNPIYDWLRAVDWSDDDMAQFTDEQVAMILNVVNRLSKKIPTGTGTEAEKVVFLDQALQTYAVDLGKGIHALGPNWANPGGAGGAVPPHKHKGTKTGDVAP